MRTGTNPGRAGTWNLPSAFVSLALHLLMSGRIAISDAVLPWLVAAFLCGTLYLAVASLATDTSAIAGRSGAAAQVLVQQLARMRVPRCGGAGPGENDGRQIE